MNSIIILTTDNREHDFDEELYNWKVADRGVFVQEIPGVKNGKIYTGVFMYPWTNIIRVYEATVKKADE